MPSWSLNPSEVDDEVESAASKTSLVVVGVILMFLRVLLEVCRIKAHVGILVFAVVVEHGVIILGSLFASCLSGLHVCVDAFDQLASCRAIIINGRRVTA